MKKISFSLILKISGIVFLAFAVVLGNEIRLGIDRYIKNTLETDAEKACVLSEELGHYHTTEGIIIDQSSAANRKQELRARLWGYNKLIGLHGIISCYKVGCQTAYDMAEHLGVTEEFLLEALQCYRNKYGVCIKFDNYVIYFEPGLSVLELI